MNTGSLTVSRFGRVEGLIAPRDVLRYDRDEDGVLSVRSVIRIPARFATFMRNGRITLAGTHPDMRAKIEDVLRHYDTLQCLVRVRKIRMTRRGIRVVGQMTRPWSRRDRRLIAGSDVSCDWRTVDGELELVGALLLYSPGYKVSGWDKATNLPGAAWQPG